MARDIASVADKDTRDDLETWSEPLPLPDGPRSEGGPATSPPRTEVTAPPNAAKVEPPSAAVKIESTAEEPQTAETGPPADSETQTEPLLENEPAARPMPAPAEAPSGDWHAAIADAISEPADYGRSSGPPASHDAGFIRLVDHESDPPGDAPPDLKAPEPSGEPAPDPTLEQPAPTVQDAQPSRAEPQPAAEAAAFTDAAEGLFRPPADEGPEEPHLITIGRRLDPSLRIPRPVPPVIQPRYEPDPEPAPPSWKNGTWKDRLRIAARYAAYAVAGYLALVLVLILLFRFVNPPGSMLMLTKLLTGNSVTRTWVPIESISPALVRAVIVSEDDRFCEHSGIDTAAMRDAIARASRGPPRGASTISMQVTKNLFLWNAKSYIRKIIEIPLTLIMEMVWPKQRILEVYLNIAEWGPGIFGAEAAAQHHFRKPASRLNEREGALLAAVLPNPVVRDAGSPGPGTSAKARVVQSRVRAYGAVASCVVSAAAPPPAPAAAKPARKTPLRAPQKKKTNSDSWSPTLNFGPQ